MIRCNNVVAFCKIKLDWNKMLLILIVEATWHPISNQHIQYQSLIINDKWKVLKIAIRLIYDCASKYHNWKNIYFKVEQRIHEILKCLIKGWRGLIFFKFTDKTSMKHHVKGKKNLVMSGLTSSSQPQLSSSLQVLCRVLMLIIILSW